MIVMTTVITNATDVMTLVTTAALGASLRFGQPDRQPQPEPDEERVR